MVFGIVDVCLSDFFVSRFNDADVLTVLNTLYPKKHMTTFSTITLTISVRLQ